MSENVAEMPEVGKKAPAFTLESTLEDEVRLSELAGRRVVLYFYPRDNTPGCTTEAKEFRDLLPEFEQLNTIVLGVSPDTLDSHCKFAEKFALNFALLVDPDHKTAEKYGVWVEKNNYGKKSMGVQRATFLIDEKGKVAQVWPRVRAQGHAQKVLEQVKALDQE